jgi:hypothetical protein
MHLPGRTENLNAVPYFSDLRDAFAQPGCAFCGLVARSANRYLDVVLWEMVLDPELRSELNEARGYCSEHGWLLVRTGSALGVAILMQHVIKTLTTVVESNPVEGTSISILEDVRRGLANDYTSKSTAPLVAELEPQTKCPVCTHVEDHERELADTLLEHLDETGALADDYRASDGLCLQHFRLSLTRAQSPAQARTLIAAQQSVWQRLHDELNEFIRKKDHRFKDEPFGSEKDSWRRALEAISGPPPVSGTEQQALTAASRGRAIQKEVPR